MKMVKGNCNKNKNTVNSEIFERIFIFANSVKKYVFVTLKIATRADLTTSLKDSDFANSRGFNFH